MFVVWFRVWWHLPPCRHADFSVNSAPSLRHYPNNEWAIAARIFVFIKKTDRLGRLHCYRRTDQATISAKKSTKNWSEVFLSLSVCLSVHLSRAQRCSLPRSRFRTFTACFCPASPNRRRWKIRLVSSLYLSSPAAAELLDTGRWFAFVTARWHRPTEAPHLFLYLLGLPVVGATGWVRRTIEDRRASATLVRICNHRRQWRNFVPYLCQLVFAAILWVKLS